MVYDIQKILAQQPQLLVLNTESGFKGAYVGTVTKQFLQKVVKMKLRLIMRRYNAFE
jgi:hypothetical protein